MAIGLRSDFDAAGVRRAARASKDGNQVRRLLALAEIYDGASRSEAAAIGGVTLQIVRDWVLKFNGSGPDGLIVCPANVEERMSAAPFDPDDGLLEIHRYDQAVIVTLDVEEIRSTRCGRSREAVSHRWCLPIPLVTSGNHAFSRRLQSGLGFMSCVCARVLVRRQTRARSAATLPS